MAASRSRAFDGFADFVHASFPSIPTDIIETDLQQASLSTYPETSYTDSEKQEISSSFSSFSKLSTSEDEAKYSERLGKLNVHLSTRTTVLGSKPSITDLALFFKLRPTIRNWSDEERTGERGYHNIVRHADFVQNSPIFKLNLTPEEKISLERDNIKFIHKPLDEKERKRKEKADVAESQGREATDSAALPVRQKGSIEDQGGAKAAKSKEKKASKQPKVPANAQPPILSPRVVDLRVGHILKAIPHPNADSLYVSSIACGDPPGTENTSEHEGQVVRTVCSGLNGLIPLEEMQNRKVITVCNLKPVTMRGIKSAAMVLAASPKLKEGEQDDHKGPVELVDPPTEAEAGERLNFEGWGGEPEGQLNPKKKVFETLQPGFTTDDSGLVGFDSAGIEALKGQVKPLGILKTRLGGECRVKTLIRGATVR